MILTLIISLITSTSIIIYLISNKRKSSIPKEYSKNARLTRDQSGKYVLKNDFGELDVKSPYSFNKMRKYDGARSRSDHNYIEDREYIEYIRKKREGQDPFWKR